MGFIFFMHFFKQNLGLFLSGFRKNHPHVGQVMGRCIAGTQTGRSDHTKMTRTSASVPLGHTIITTELSQGNAYEQATAALLADARCGNSDTRWWVKHDLSTDYWSPKCYLHHIGFSIKSFSGKGEYLLYFVYVLLCHCEVTWWVKIYINKAYM